MKDSPKTIIIASPFMTLKETAAFFRFDETSIRRSLGVFAKLRRTTLNKRTLIYRESVEQLKAELDKQSYVIAEGGLAKKRP
jgi:hypothetical protein